MKMKKQIVALALMGGLAGTVAAPQGAAPNAEVGYLIAKHWLGDSGLAHAAAQNGAAAGVGELGYIAGRALTARAAGWAGAKLGAMIGSAGGPVGAIIGGLTGAA